MTFCHSVKMVCILPGMNHESKRTNITCGVPQGPILVSLLFNIYMLPLAQSIESFNIFHHTYANNTQLYIQVSPCTPCVQSN